MRLDGTTACVTIEGATNIEVFQAYVRVILVAEFRRGGIVILDNLRAHKNELTLALIRQASAEARFLPDYSPDLHPIEMMWSNVDALLRKAQARSRPDSPTTSRMPSPALHPRTLSAGLPIWLSLYLKRSNGPLFAARAQSEARHHPGAAGTLALT